MNLRSKFLTGLIIGAASGTALTLFAKSRKGKEMTARVGKMANEVKDAGQEVLQQEIDALYSKSRKLKNKAKKISKKIGTFSTDSTEEISNSN